MGCRKAIFGSSVERARRFSLTPEQAAMLRNAWAAGAWTMEREWREVRRGDGAGLTCAATPLAHASALNSLRYSLRARRLTKTQTSMSTMPATPRSTEKPKLMERTLCYCWERIQSTTEHFGLLNVPVTCIGKTSLPCCESAPLNSLANVLTKKPCFVWMVALPL